ncbi:uncharacterized protein KY384_003484 [Bacidia gigantensis]|uniref:uncharacterized protein n=1 Tax=Bacidia gigantensis TaxID=2732470 RepID=UPI001D03B17B|nr:uncharacterized protein KY384_003484 [Bacidia gigantensis]KAG8531848.1 hypothetical protein KY384_003484 [Bacidia gigantensis]
MSILQETIEFIAPGIPTVFRDPYPVNSSSVAENEINSTLNGLAFWKRQDDVVMMWAEEINKPIKDQNRDLIKKLEIIREEWLMMRETHKEQVKKGWVPPKRDYESERRAREEAIEEEMSSQFREQVDPAMYEDSTHSHPQTPRRAYMTPDSNKRKRSSTEDDEDLSANPDQPRKKVKDLTHTLQPRSEENKSKDISLREVDGPRLIPDILVPGESQTEANGASSIRSKSPNITVVMKTKTSPNNGGKTKRRNQANAPKTTNKGPRRPINPPQTTSKVGKGQPDNPRTKNKEKLPPLLRPGTRSQGMGAALSLHLDKRGQIVLESPTGKQKMMSMKRLASRMIGVKG